MNGGQAFTEVKKVVIKKDSTLETMGAFARTLGQSTKRADKISKKKKGGRGL